MGGKKREKVRIHVRQVDWNKTLMKGCSDGNKKPLHTNQAEGREGEKNSFFFCQLLDGNLTIESLQSVL